MKLDVQKNHLGRQILYRSPNPVKKRRLSNNKTLAEAEFSEKLQEFIRAYAFSHQVTISILTLIIMLRDFRFWKNRNISKNDFFFQNFRRFSFGGTLSSSAVCWLFEVTWPKDFIYFKPH